VEGRDLIDRREVLLHHFRLTGSLQCTDVLEMQYRLRASFVNRFFRKAAVTRRLSSAVHAVRSTILDAVIGPTVTLSVAHSSIHRT
jgi:hypothetical protein